MDIEEQFVKFLESDLFPFEMDIKRIVDCNYCKCQYVETSEFTQDSCKDCSPFIPKYYRNYEIYKPIRASVTEYDGGKYKVLTGFSRAYNYREFRCVMFDKFIFQECVKNNLNCMHVITEHKKQHYKPDKYHCAVYQNQ